MINMTPSVLVTKTSIFIDFENLICSTDLYVIKKLLEENSITGYKYSYLHEIYSEFTGEPDEYIKERILFKKINSNILMDFLDYKEIKKCNYIEMMDLLYYTYLYKDKNDFIENIEFTSIAKSFKLLLKDKNLEKITIFLGDKKRLNPIVHEAIYKFFEKSTKIELSCGDKEYILHNMVFNTYILNNAIDIKYLVYERKDFADIYIPDYKSNIKYVKLNKSDSTKVKTILMPQKYEDLSSKYHIAISMIELPI